MLHRWLLYTWMAWLDIRRLWPAVWPQVVVVAGICLPILLLQGLKRGHVADLRQEFLKSPTGRQILVYSKQQRKLTRKSLFDQLQHELVGVEVVIPHAERVGNLAHRPGDRSVSEVTDVKFVSTSPGDPLLKLAGGDVLTRGEHAVVLPAPLAELLGVAVGDSVELTIKTRQGLSPPVPMLVKAVLTYSEDDRTAFLNVQVLDWLNEFLQGAGSPELNLPAASSAEVGYAGYLLFCEKNDDLRARDYDTFKQKFLTVEKVEDEELRTLYGLLPNKDLKVYFVHDYSSHRDPTRRLHQDWEDLAEATEAGDVWVPWNTPQIRVIDGVPYRLIGFSLPPLRKCWLRSYFADSSFPFEDAPDFLKIRFPLDSTIDKNSKSLKLPLPGQQRTAELKLEVGHERSNTDALFATLVAVESCLLRGSAPDPLLPCLVGLLKFEERKRLGARRAQPIPALVPIDFLAHLDALENRTVRYDPVGQKFVPLPSEPSYISGRLYCNTIDEVPSVVRQLEERELRHKAEGDRIAEIHNQDASLRSIVIIVGLGVLLFGTCTVGSVLFESTARKRGTIGILRAMGVSRGGIFYLVVVRSAMIGFLAGCLTVILGALFAWSLRFLDIKVLLETGDFCLVFPVALLCCVVGSIFPAWTASNLDPFDAILEGKFR